MSGAQSESQLIIPSLREIRSLADGTYTGMTGNIIGTNPELMRELVESNKAILAQLSGQPKADFFHRFYFDLKGEANYGEAAQADTDFFWQEMADDDPEVAGWLAVLKAQEEELGDMESRVQARDSIIEAALGRIANHPKVLTHGTFDSRAAGFTSQYEEYGGTTVSLILHGPPSRHDPTYAYIDVFGPAQPLGQEAYITSSIRRPNDLGVKKIIMRELEEGQRLAKVGDRFTFNRGTPGIQNSRYEIIDYADASEEAMARFLEQYTKEEDSDELPVDHVTEAAIIRPSLKELRAIKDLIEGAQETELPIAA